MTVNCLDIANALSDFFKGHLCENVSTENLLYAWIVTNDAEDIYSCLLCMMQNPHKLYSEDVKNKLKDLNKLIKQEKESKNETKSM